MGNNANSKNKIILPDLSYKIVGAGFAVFNELGYGFPEKIYQRAFGEELSRLGLTYAREVYIPVHYKDKPLYRYYADYIVERKSLLSLK
jgi:GxxExxY protein